MKVKKTIFGIVGAVAVIGIAGLALYQRSSGPGIRAGVHGRRGAHGPARR